MAAPVGALVGLTYDNPAAELETGHALVTARGRVYVVQDARRQLRGKHAGRWHVRAWIAAAVPPAAKRWPLEWNHRG